MKSSIARELLFLLTLVFVTINVVQTWLILRYKLLIKGGIIVALLEAIEAPLIIYLILKGGVIVFFMVIITETFQWLFIGYSATKD